MTKSLLALLTLAMMTGAATTAVYSQATTTAPRSAQGDLVRFSFFQPFNPKNRIELVRLSDAYCREVLDTVPTNTPAEDAWVTAESKTSDTNRITRLVSSKEWARHQLKETFSECLQKVASRRKRTMHVRQKQRNSSVWRSPSITTPISTCSPNALT
jgi:hypothetical protein